MLRSMPVLHCLVHRHSLFAGARPALCPLLSVPWRHQRSPAINPDDVRIRLTRMETTTTTSRYYRRLLLALYRFRVLTGWGSYFT
jgi:hypothetical protein